MAIIASAQGSTIVTSTGNSNYYTYIEMNKTADTSTGIKYTIHVYTQVSKGDFTGTHFTQSAVSGTNITSESILLYGMKKYCDHTSQELSMNYGQTVTYTVTGKRDNYSGTSTATLSYTLPYPTYTIAYNANGGSGTTKSQTKTHGTNISLRSSGFTRAGYVFKCWNTNSSGTGTNYNAGASYTANANVTLYAIWQAAVPTITAAGYRVDSVNSTTLNSKGTVVYIKVNYSYSAVPQSAVRKVYVNDNVMYTSAASTSQSGTYDCWVSGVSLEGAHTFNVKLWDAQGGYTNVKSFHISGYASYDYDLQYDRKHKTVNTPYAFLAYTKTVGFQHKREDTEQSVGFGIGSGGYNRGIYDYNKVQWSLYWDDAGSLRMSNYHGDTTTTLGFNSTNLYPSTNGTISLGYNVNRFNHLFLNGNIYAKGHSGAIGEVVSATGLSTNTQIASNPVSVCSITLSPGSWVIHACVRVANVTTDAYAHANIATDATNTSSQVRIYIPKGSGTVSTFNNTVQMNFSISVTPTASTTYYLNVCSNSASTYVIGDSGGSNYVTGMRAIRIA